MGRKIAIGSDHAGYSLKEAVKSHLISRGEAVDDFGTGGDEAVDYPDFGEQVARRVSEGETDLGVLVCGSGIGMSIVANKFPGVRAALASNEHWAEMARRHNDANVLVLAGRGVDDRQGCRIVTAWLESPFEGGRHQRRIDKISALETRLKERNNGASDQR